MEMRQDSIQVGTLTIGIAGQDFGALTPESFGVGIESNLAEVIDLPADRNFEFRLLEIRSGSTWFDYGIFFAIVGAVQANLIAYTRMKSGLEELTADIESIKARLKATLGRSVQRGPEIIDETLTLESEETARKRQSQLENILDITLTLESEEQMKERLQNLMVRTPEE